MKSPSGRVVRSAGHTEPSVRTAPRAGSASREAAEISATAYAWYVRVVQQKVSENWLKYEIDPNIHQANRVLRSFRHQAIRPAGKCQIEQSSGVPSLDQSAVRAIQRIDTLRPFAPRLFGQQSDGGVLV